MAYSGTQLFLIYSGLFFAALVFSLLVNSLFMRFARTLGMREKDQLIERWSASYKPAFGGIGFYILFLACFTLHGVLFPGEVAVLRPELLGLLAATSLGFLMGLADDAYNTRPVLKFMVQLGCGGILIASGTCINLFEAQWANVALTLFWVVGMMNSINMLDNMDAVATSVTIAILSAATVVMIATNAMDPVYMVLLVGTMAALAGFLFYNWNPSRMFMGDTGSQFLGVLIAFVGIRFFWNMQGPTGAWEPARQVIMPLIVFLLPIADTATVSINRIMRGHSPFVGGRDHTTHHLSYLGLSDGQVALVFIGLSLVNVFLAFTMARFIIIWGNLHTVAFVSYGLLVFGTLFAITRRSRPHP
ncbi:MAG: undecaprenyl/decaprenyl-phosphate alpha-N-acetylglucosaminyl 1-phosphate transferase [Flavobacteriales bacterium]|nr:undecaprenyl/decaprenyl-phosphate alpha-N-acetylglucosaminyl 1-phosphate transferase [Flavobacteriales bacterium]